MGELSIWHWAVVTIFVAAYVTPMWIITKRIGFWGWLSLLMLIPVLNIAFFWWLAVARWPRDRSDFDPFAKDIH